MWFPTVHVQSANNMLLVVRSTHARADCTAKIKLITFSTSSRSFFWLAVLTCHIELSPVCNTPTIDASTHSHVLVRSDKQKKAPLCTIIIIIIII
jgi:hypothetical protein